MYAFMANFSKANQLVLIDRSNGAIRIVDENYIKKTVD